MVISTNPIPKCNRCGATKEEAPLTRSHAPHTGLLKHVGLSPSERARFLRVYILCETCRKNHLQLEQKAIKKFCRKLVDLHEKYLNQ